MSRETWKRPFNQLLTCRALQTWTEAEQTSEDRWRLLCLWLRPHPNPVPGRMVPANPAVLAGSCRQL